MSCESPYGSYRHSPYPYDGVQRCDSDGTWGACVCPPVYEPGGSGGKPGSGTGGKWGTGGAPGTGGADAGGGADGAADGAVDGATADGATADADARSDDAP
jgi:hypothetical protein